MARTFERPANGTIIKWVIGIVIALVIFRIPMQFDDPTLLDYSDIIIVAVATLSLALLTGFNGQISIGHGAFFGIGAYTSAILVADHGWGHFATIPAAALITFVVGLLAGIPALRIKGIYLALTTLALATLFPAVVKRFTSVTGGSEGKNVPVLKAPNRSLPLVGQLNGVQYRYYVLVVIAALCFLLVRNLMHSRMGRALIAIRDNEIAASTSGVPLARYRVMTFGISAMIAGIAGSMYTFHKAFVSAEEFSTLKSIEFIAALVIGGAASIGGPVLGAYLIFQIQQVLQNRTDNPAWAQILYGAMLIVLMYVLPQGLVGLYRRLKARAVGLLAGRGRAAPPEPPTPTTDPPAVQEGAIS
ncbi:MAG: transporter permease [Acidimicrobiales bacterium]|nr:transporter permease [Acidimicrobiales bacterium]